MYKNILDAALVFCLVPVTFTVCHNLSTYSTRILSMLNKKQLKGFETSYSS